MKGRLQSLDALRGFDMLWILGLSSGRIHLRILKRVLLLAALQMVQSGALWFDPAHYFYPSVLIRIALSWALAALAKPMVAEVDDKSERDVHQLHVGKQLCLVPNHVDRRCRPW